MSTYTDRLTTSKTTSSPVFKDTKFNPLSETFVLEILGLDLSSNLTDELINALQVLLAEHAVLVIRGQNLSQEQQDEFTRSFGKQRDQRLHVWTPEADAEAKVGRDGALGQLPILNNGEQLFFINGPGLCDTDHDPSVILDMKDQYKMHGTSCWHTGDTEKENVEVVNILYPVIVPERHGHTQFANTTAAYEAMDKPTKDELDKLRAIHCMVFPELDWVDMPDPTPPISQALVKRHEFTGKKFLYLNFHDMDRIIGKTRQESDQLIKTLFDQTIREPFLYSHEWCEGDLVVWDCNGTLHRKGLLDPTCKRALRRTQTEVSLLQSKRDWDKSRKAEKHEHNGEFWHPFPLKD